MIKVLIADDHAIVRRGVREILSEMTIPLEIFETDSVKSTVAALLQTPFEILLLDISFPDGSGLDVLDRVQAAKLTTRILFLSMYPEEQYARRVLRGGAFGYLTKDSAPTELTTAMEKVIQGGRYVTLSLAELLADELVSPSPKYSHEALSDREFQVMIALADGKSISQIAQELSLSPKTVSTYRARILEKLRLNSTAEIIRYAIDQGL
jgi:DNA-binding NarL/FixJ family response regulator